MHFVGHIIQVKGFGNKKCVHSGTLHCFHFRPLVCFQFVFLSHIYFPLPRGSFCLVYNSIYYMYVHVLLYKYTYILNQGNRYLCFDTMSMSDSVNSQSQYYRTYDMLLYLVLISVYTFKWVKWLTHSSF